MEMVSPMVFSGRKYSAAGVPIRASKHRVISHAPPTAIPLSAATTGTRVSSAARVMSWNSSMCEVRLSGGSSAASRRSSPAENARPVPVSTIPRTESPPPKWRRIAASSRHASAVSALSLSGRLSVTTATASCTATPMWPDSAPQTAVTLSLSILTYLARCGSVRVGRAGRDAKIRSALRW